MAARPWMVRVRPLGYTIHALRERGYGRSLQSAVCTISPKLQTAHNRQTPVYASGSSMVTWTLLSMIPAAMA